MDTCQTSGCRFWFVHMGNESRTYKSLHGRTPKRCSLFPHQHSAADTDKSTGSLPLSIIIAPSLSHLHPLLPNNDRQFTATTCGDRIESKPRRAKWRRDKASWEVASSLWRRWEEGGGDGGGGRGDGQHLSPPILVYCEMNIKNICSNLGSVLHWTPTTCPFYYQDHFH